MATDRRPIEDTTAAGAVASLNVSDGGVPKSPVREVQVTVDGIRGDRQRNRKYHGGPDRAVCLYSLDRLNALRAEGHPITVGSTGENVTLSGVAWERVVPGARLALGPTVVVEVTGYAAPCRTIRGAFVGGRSTRISQKLAPGWSRVYARVLREGRVAVGDRAVLADGPGAAAVPDLKVRA
jgi:MOSC domain-containing protein YiiM